MLLCFLRTSYATLRFPYMFRYFSRNSSFLGIMKPGSGNSSVRRQNVGTGRPSLNVPKNPDLGSEKEFPSLETSISLSKGKKKPRIDLISGLDPKSEIGSVRPKTLSKTIPPSQHTESYPPPSSHMKYATTGISLLQPQTPLKTNTKVTADICSVQFRSPQTENSTNMRDDFSHNKIYRKKNVALGIEQESKLTESPVTAFSTSQMDEWSSPTSFGKKNVSYPKRKSNFHREYEVVKQFDICIRTSAKTSMLKEKSEQNLFEIENSVEESKQVLKQGMVLLKNYLTIDEQVEIVKRCRELGVGSSGGFYQPGYNDGAKLRLQMMCLGKNWDPQTKYKEERRKDGSVPPCIPIEFTLLVKKALEISNSLIKQHFGTIDIENCIPSMKPDICIVNFYSTTGRLGLHQDRDESEWSLNEGLPVVSFSVGDAAEFLYGDQRDVKKAENVTLESGDVLIFGGKSRHIFHGVTSIFPNSAPPDLLEKTMLRPGRLNLTFRQY